MDRRYYVNGSSALQEEYEVERPSRSTRDKRQERRLREEQARIQLEAKQRRHAKLNRMNAVVMSPAYMLFLSVGTVAIAFAIYFMVSTQTSLNSGMRQIASLQSQLEDARAKNDARYKEITTNVDLNSVKAVAINQLGMDYATMDQIVFYNVEKSNYMDQYGDIPQ